ncbi:hypothetical protein PLESTB_001794600 [Pleodorina starrii]|uniref:Uncharacterized protein n=1 Tax=Pleodorina starrii TaxID=330485 RepID=A0A9W6FAE3_9CHLO|nr:hypothetical protein PLESTM_001158900 [Pleodorina starrii]GLC61710.1 hypothetical protein PLESTB_001794600 [Pleodorina starrii]
MLGSWFSSEDGTWFGWLVGWPPLQNAVADALRTECAVQVVVVKVLLEGARGPRQVAAAAAAAPPRRLLVCGDFRCPSASDDGACGARECTAGGCDGVFGRAEMLFGEKGGATGVCSVCALAWLEGVVGCMAARLRPRRRLDFLISAASAVGAGRRRMCMFGLVFCLVFLSAAVVFQVDNVEPCGVRVWVFRFRLLVVAVSCSRCCMCVSLFRFSC